MPHLVFRSKMPCSQAELWQFHSNSEALHQLNPPGTRVILDGELRVEDGATLKVTSVALGVFRQHWSVEIFDVQPPSGFKDRAEMGAFKSWLHHHEFVETGVESELVDSIQFEAKGGVIGNFVASSIIRALFWHRHRVTKRLVTPGGLVSKSQAQ